MEESSLKINTKMHYKTVQEDFEWLVSQYENGNFILLKNIQRHDQKESWVAGPDGAFSEKTETYLDMCFNGAATLSTFTIVTLDVFSRECQNQLEIVDDRIRNSEGEPTMQDQKQKDLLIKLLKEVEAKKEKPGTPKAILLDGQNRLEYALKPFFTGVENKKSEIIFPEFNSRLGIQLCDGNDPKEKNVGEPLKNISFNKLTHDQQQAFLKTPVVVNIGEKGKVEQIIDTLISINDGIPWTPFEKFAVRWTPIVERMNDMIAYNKKPELTNLFNNVPKMTGSYAPNKKGDGKMMLELCFWMYKKEFPRLVQLDNFTRSTSCPTKLGKDYDDIKKLEYYNILEKYLEIISEAVGTATGNNKVFANTFNKESGIRSVVMLFFILEGYRNGDYWSELKDVMRGKEFRVGKSLKQPFRFVEEFCKWHAMKTSPKTCPQDYQVIGQVKNEDGVLVDVHGSKPKEGTYADSLNSITQNVAYREKGIIEFIKTRMKKMEDQGIVRLLIKRSTEQEPHVLELLQKTQSQDPYSRTNTSLDKLSIMDPLHKDHIKPLSKGGNNSLDNMVMTTPQNNLRKSDKIL